MILGIAFCLVVIGVGALVLRALGLARGVPAIGLAPGAGIAALAIPATWSSALGLPGWLVPLAILLAGGAGLVLLALDIAPHTRQLATLSRRGLSLGLLFLAVLVPALILGASFTNSGVPLSTHDGAFHVESIHLLREGGSWGGWYPPGYHAAIAAVLTVVPWVDSAAGAFQTSLGLALLGPLAAFGLGHVVWRSGLVAAAGALIVALTFQYPYDPQVWGGWPMAASMVLLLSLWTTAVRYLAEPGYRWAVLAAILAGAIVLTHGTEVYSTILGLVVLVVAYRSRTTWRRLAWDVPLALALAMVLAAPYLPNLLDWAGGGAAIRAGMQALDPAHPLFPGGLPKDPMFLLLHAVGASSPIHVPARVALIAAGMIWVLHTRRGGAFVGLWFLFNAVVLTFSFAEVGAVQYLFALTFPWGLTDRLGQSLAVVSGLLGGAGAVALAHWLGGLRWRYPELIGPKHPSAWRRTVLAAGLVTFFVAWGSVVTVYKTFEVARDATSTFSPEDAEAAAWLRANAEPNRVVANDYSADAGIWLPYKAGVPILVNQTEGNAQPLPVERLVLANIGNLERSPEAQAAACAMGVRYVYRGATGTGYHPRRFPELEELRRSTVLDEVFTSGEASVFKVRLACFEHETVLQVQLPT